MHVAGLQIFKLPNDAPDDFIKNVVKTLRNPQKLAHPWNKKLVSVRLGSLVPAMAVAPTIEMDYHVRHTCLPSPGGERELGELISHLHSVMLDRSRPLWTCHVIEGLENQRFAIYIKIHHAIMDGVKGIHILTRCLGTTPTEHNWVAPWCTRARSGVSKKEATLPPRSQGSWQSLLDLPSSVKKAFIPLLRRDPTLEPVRLPFEAPRCVLNGPVTASRRVATQQLDLKRIKQIAARTGATVNDVFLAIASAAIRRHLQDNHQLPENSLCAGVPVSLRDTVASDEDGNAVGFLWTLLGTHIADPLQRLELIRKSMQASKQHLHSLSAPMRSLLTTVTMFPAIAVLLSGQGARLPPPMNLVISNVPGPQHSLYLDRARLEAIYPVSIPTQGQALNISCISYDGRLGVGFTGSRDQLPSLQRLAVYLADALDELEQALPRAA